ncbi:MAG: TonB-dependent receptor [Lentisphaeraceae bacterium]|nr:TonB-dependent receptor [Lentisphaeraceae bacterium]
MFFLKISRRAVSGIGAALITFIMFQSVHAQNPDAKNDNGAEKKDGVIKENVKVVGENIEQGYEAKNASSGTKTDTPILKTPISVQVIPKGIIDEQGALGLEDVYKNVSGVYQSGNTLNAQSEVRPIIRGFESPNIFLNGMRGTGFGAIDLFNVERIEILKGPASILYGAAEPGGIMNIITKKPLAHDFNEITAEFGTYEHYRFTLDSTGPLNEDEDLLYRLNMAYTNSESFRNVMDLDRFAIAPALTWLIAPKTELTLEATYTRERTPYDSGVPLGFNGEKLVPIDTFFGDPDLDGRTLEDFVIAAELNHEINKYLSVRSRLQYHRANPMNESIRHRGVRGTVGAEELRLRYQNEERTDEEWQLVTDFLSEFKTGDIKHKTVFGFDLRREEVEFDRFRQNLPNVLISPDPNFNFDPPANNHPADDQLSELEWGAIYLQDQISMLKDDKLQILLGGRYDYFEQQSLSSDVSQSEGAFTFRGGVLYQLTDWLAPFVSYTESFNPALTAETDVNGDVLAPETGRQYELGFKMNFFEERLQTTIAFFDLEKNEVPDFDVNTSSFLPGVDQRSRGVELDVLGRITDNVSLIANYAYTDTEMISNGNDPDEEKDRLGGVPLHSGRLWLTYNFSEGSSLEGLGAGLGLRYESKKHADFDTTELDDSLIFDAGVWYNTELSNGHKLKVQLNIENITNREYYSRASAQDIVHPGSPLAVKLTVGYEF